MTALPVVGVIVTVPVHVAADSPTALAVMVRFAAPALLIDVVFRPAASQVLPQVVVLTTGVPRVTAVLLVVETVTLPKTVPPTAAANGRLLVLSEMTPPPPPPPPPDPLVQETVNEVAVTPLGADGVSVTVAVYVPASIPAVLLICTPTLAGVV